MAVRGTFVQGLPARGEQRRVLFGKLVQGQNVHGKIVNGDAVDKDVAFWVVVLVRYDK